jgi:hypothetical protein
MELMKGEKQILESDQGQIILTTHRVRLDISMVGRRKIVSMMLNEVSSCSLKYKSNTTLIILAVASFVLGIMGGSKTIVGGIIGACIFGAAFYITRKQVLTISSSGESMSIETKGLSSSEVAEFIDSAEKAKYIFYRSHSINVKQGENK